MVILSLILFLLGAIMPLLSGVFLCAVPASHRVVACSMSSMIQLIIGHAPSTLIYGLVSSSSLTPDSSRIPMTVILYSTVFSTMLLLISLVKSLKNQSNSVDTSSKGIKGVGHSYNTPGNIYLADPESSARARREPLLLYDSNESNNSGNYSPHIKHSTDSK